MNEPDIVVKVRAAVIKHLESAVDFAGPTVLEDVLAHVATVPYRGDNDAYLAEAVEALKVATETAIRPHIDASEARRAALQAQADEMAARTERFLREFEEFRRLTVSDVVH